MKHILYEFSYIVCSTSELFFFVYAAWVWPHKSSFNTLVAVICNSLVWPQLFHACIYWEILMSVTLFIPTSESVWEVFIPFQVSKSVSDCLLWVSLFSLKIVLNQDIDIFANYDSVDLLLPPKWGLIAQMEHYICLCIRDVNIILKYYPFSLLQLYQLNGAMVL